MTSGNDGGILPFIKLMLRSRAILATTSDDYVYVYCVMWLSIKDAGVQVNRLPALRGFGAGIKHCLLERASYALVQCS